MIQLQNLVKKWTSFDCNALRIITLENKGTMELHLTVSAKNHYQYNTCMLVTM